VKNLALMPVVCATMLSACSKFSSYDSDIVRESNMLIHVPAFESGGRIPSKYTCDGENINPELIFEEVPDNARSLVLIMDDPDVPKSIRADGMWDHWIVFNIPPDTERISENEQPTGTAGKGTSGNLAYGGPCPPDREHRYFFKLFALDTLLDLPEGSTKSEVLKAMEGHVIAEGEIVRRYERNSKFKMQN